MYLQIVVNNVLLTICTYVHSITLHAFAIFPLWQWLLQSVPFFLQWHLLVPQVPGWQLYLFPIKALSVHGFSPNHSLRYCSNQQMVLNYQPGNIYQRHKSCTTDNTCLVACLLPGQWHMCTSVADWSIQRICKPTLAPTIDFFNLCTNKCLRFILSAFLLYWTYAFSCTILFLHSSKWLLFSMCFAVTLLCGLAAIFLLFWAMTVECFWNVIILFILATTVLLFWLCLSCSSWLWLS